MTVDQAPPPSPVLAGAATEAVADRGSRALVLRRRDRRADRAAARARLVRLLLS